jgi:poly(3-hydroxybutyrate) depolymerase
VRFVVLLILAAIGSPASVGADRAKTPAAPCADCTLDVPDVSGKLPLLVVLHGDREQAATAAVRWRAAARKRGWVVLSVQCPTSEGCKDSWWQWNGELTYLRDQIEKVERLVSIDDTRIALAGWSGGASYIGLRNAELAMFSGVVMHGGGIPPRGDACPTRALPAYFLVGDKNPLHRLVVDLRAHFDTCKQLVRWDVVRNGGHEAEAQALTLQKAIAILDWLALHPLVTRTSRRRSRGARRSSGRSGLNMPPTLVTGEPPDVDREALVEAPDEEVSTQR